MFIVHFSFPNFFFSGGGGGGGGGGGVGGGERNQKKCPWTGSKMGVHGPRVHVLSSPKLF